MDGPETPAARTGATLADETPGGPGLATRVAGGAGRFARGFVRFVGTLFVIGFSLLPLAALLAALPLVAPNEAVLSDTVKTTRSGWVRFRRRVLAAVAGALVLVALLGFAIEVVTRLPLPEGGQLAALSKKVLGYSVVDMPGLFSDGPRLEDDPALKPVLDRYDVVKKDLIRPDLTDPDRAAGLKELAAINRELADWAARKNRAWVVPPKLLADREAAVSADPAGSAAGRLENDVAEEVVAAARQQLPPADLLKKRDTLLDSIGRANESPVDRKENEARLERVEAEIGDRAAGSSRLRTMLDPEQSRWLARPLWTFLPPALVQHWAFVFLIVYATDLFLLLLIGRVPLAYNFRYLWVRKRDTALTALAFTVVVALVVVLLAFVNGMYKLNESTGIPGNVLVLAEGSTDELFSNLGRADADNVERIEVPRAGGGAYRVARATLGADGKLTPLPADAPKGTPGEVYLASSESYMVMNQPVPVKDGEKPRRRFVQVRAMRSAPVAAAVHNMDLYPGGKWFSQTGVEPGPDGKNYLQCVVGEGAAGTLGPDLGKPKLEVGDTFQLGDMGWIVTGVMKSQGTTFGSEVWTSVDNAVVQAAGKGNRFTTLVLRMADNSDAAAKAAADYLNKDYNQAKLKAFAEPDYYKELTKTNEQFLNWIVILAVVMAVGGVFGVMNTMFASIAARIKEVGVLRILGFKRWQILISFMIESLTIAFVGGVLGCALGYLANGFEASSTLSGGQGGGKSVALKMIVDYQTIAAGMLFTLVMGRLGGLVPALSAMRMEILDSLR